MEKRKPLSQDEIGEIHEAFELFDKDGDGTISTGELKIVLRCFGKKATDEHVSAIINKYGYNEGDDLYFEQF